MNEVKKALRPVKNRIRRNRFIQGAAAGLAAGLGAALLLRAVSFFLLVPDCTLWAAAVCAAVPVLAAAGNALRPVRNETAAEAADACGLKERAITALEDGDSGIRIRQRRDACEALAGLDVKKIRPGSARKPLLAALACALALGTLLAVPGPRDADAAAAKALSLTLQEGRKEIRQAAEKDEEELTDEARSELRKLTEDLQRELGTSRDAADAMVALDRAEQRLEQLRRQTAGEAAAAMDKAGESGSASETGKTEGNKAADAAPAGTAQQGAAAGQMTKTLQAISALKTAVNPSAAKANGSQGQGGSQGTQGNSGTQGSSGTQGASGTQSGQNGSGAQGASGTQQGGQNGQGSSGSGGNRTGGGAGEGSTNEEQQGSGNAGTHSAAGGRSPRYKTEQYETIYDPERIDRGREDVMTEQNRLGDEDAEQAEIGPGRGSLDGNVPWNEALNDYAETEARAADRENLTVQERQWVNEYFSLLTEQK